MGHFSPSVFLENMIDWEESLPCSQSHACRPSTVPISPDILLNFDACDIWRDNALSSHLAFHSLSDTEWKSFFTPWVFVVSVEKRNFVCISPFWQDHLSSISSKRKKKHLVARCADGSCRYGTELGKYPIGVKVPTKVTPQYRRVCDH